MDARTLFDEVYRTSFEWARLGGEVRSTPWGKAVFNTSQPDYREANCAWYFDPGDDFEAAFEGIKCHHEAVGNSCYNWIPTVNTEAVRRGFEGREYEDQRATALVRRLDTMVSLPYDFTVLVAHEHRDELAAVYRLGGQRWGDAAALNRALSVLEQPTYEGFVCRWKDEVIGRIGLLKTDGEMARLKSVFVGASTRGRGFGQVMIDFIANRANSLGYAWLGSEVDVDNAPSQRCHLKAGFRSAGIVHCYCTIPT